MDDHAKPTYELVEVKAEDILSERQSFYSTFMGGTKAAVGVTVAVLLLMWVFLV